MFKTAFELQQFVEWAKDLKIKSVSIGDIKIEFSELAFIPETDLKELNNGGATTLAESEPLDPKEQEELEFWSA
jgi:DNA-binding transcriptional regulator LsrR (DeoR family)